MRSARPPSAVDRLRTDESPWSAHHQLSTFTCTGLSTFKRTPTTPNTSHHHPTPTARQPGRRGEVRALTTRKSGPDLRLYNGQARSCAPDSGGHGGADGGGDSGRPARCLVAAQPNAPGCVGRPRGPGAPRESAPPQCRRSPCARVPGPEAEGWCLAPATKPPPRTPGPFPSDHLIVG